MSSVLTATFNRIYEEKGFEGVLDYVISMLEYGGVTKEDELYCITTGGWSEDEDVIHALICFYSLFWYKHYVGYLRGGAYYFAEDMDNDFEIKKVIPNRIPED